MGGIQDHLMINKRIAEIIYNLICVVALHTIMTT